MGGMKVRLYRGEREGIRGCKLRLSSVADAMIVKRKGSGAGDVVNEEQYDEEEKINCGMNFL